MSTATIKKEFLSQRIGFNNSAKPLGHRTDIDDLAILAHQSKDPTLLRLFDHLPDLATLKKEKTDLALKKGVPAAVKDKATTTPGN